MDQHRVNEREWNADENWRWGVYYAPRDRRVWVPKRSKWMGITLNFAHRSAYLWLAMLLSPALAVIGAIVAVVL
ncbi:MAG: DUF5808 domain-containing protein [Planctomycetota bacterium]